MQIVHTTDCSPAKRMITSRSHSRAVYAGELRITSKTSRPRSDVSS